VDSNGFEVFIIETINKYKHRNSLHNDAPVSLTTLLRRPTCSRVRTGEGGEGKRLQTVQHSAKPVRSVEMFGGNMSIARRCRQVDYYSSRRCLFVSTHVSNIDVFTYRVIRLLLTVFTVGFRPRFKNIFFFRRLSEWCSRRFQK